tara:strand:+ start:146 stop:394 length:249 start_codon:yes stop_codon:yes gene_type:complete
LTHYWKVLERQPAPIRLRAGAPKEPADPGTDAQGEGRIDPIPAAAVVEAVDAVADTTTKISINFSVRLSESRSPVELQYLLL